MKIVNIDSLSVLEYAARVQARAACAMVEIAVMRAENAVRAHAGSALAYSGEDFCTIIDKYDVGKDAWWHLK